VNSFLIVITLMALVALLCLILEYLDKDRW